MDKGIEDKIKQTLSDNYIVEDLNPARFNNLVQALTKLVEGEKKEYRKPKYPGWYCPNCKLGSSRGGGTVIYDASQADVDRHYDEFHLSTLSPEQEGSKK